MSDKTLSAFELATIKFQELTEQRKEIVAEWRKRSASIDAIDAQIRVLTEIQGAAVAQSSPAPAAT